MIDVTIKVHQHYVTTKTRFWGRGDSYTEFCVATHEFPARMLQITGHRDLWECCMSHVLDTPSDFPTFPYPAYLEVCLRYDEKHVCSVQSARYSFVSMIFDIGGLILAIIGLILAIICAFNTDEQ